MLNEDKIRNSAIALSRSLVCSTIDPQIVHKYSYSCRKLVCEEKEGSLVWLWLRVAALVSFKNIFRHSLSTISL